MHVSTSTDTETEDRAAQVRKRILKLRWIGMEREADELARSTPEANGSAGTRLPLHVAATD